ncbi:MAG: VCBS repeat-containing protein [Opitutaceae bacterium]|nr:VCBS repeat-containing protein [Opitutaceae bacterium]
MFIRLKNMPLVIGCLGALLLAVSASGRAAQVSGASPKAPRGAAVEARALVNRGFEDFARGAFEDGGSNLYVNAQGKVQMIHTWDVNGDSYPDLVLANSHDYKERGPTRIHRVALPGQVETPFQELANDSGWMSRIVDLDQDGFVDLIVANGENGVSSELLSYIYWGGPRGLTGQRTDLPTMGAYDVAVLDLDRDGKLDLVFPSAWTDHHNPGQPLLARVYLAKGDRTFNDASERFGISGTAAVAIAAADLNGDGQSDLVVANYRRDFELDTASVIYWGTPAGVEARNPQRILTHGAQNVILADLNGDHAPDIVFSGANRVQICWNQQGKFSAEHQRIISAPGFSSMFSNGTVRCAVADLDLDAVPELILATREGLEIRSSSDLSRVQQRLAVKDLHWVSAADLNGDGRPELISSRYTDGMLYDTTSPIFWNSATGFSSDRVTWIPTQGAVGNTAGDLDGDGSPEVVFNSTMSGHLKGIHNYIYWGNQDAAYGPAHRLELPTDGTGQAFVADLDLDGWPECVFTGPGADLRIFAGSPSGPSADRYTDLPANEGIQDLQVADFNRDGYLDILAVSQVYDTSPATLAKSARIYHGSRQGFALERSQPLPMYGNAAYLADVNRDGFLDILCNDKRDYILIYFGGRAGYAEERSAKVPAVNPLAVNTADLNGDGWLDLIISCGGHYRRLKDTHRIYYGSPKGFREENSQTYSAGYTPIFTAVADFNRDGNLDLAATAYSSATERVLPARIFWGNGKRIDFEHPFNLPAESAAAVTQLDLNRDGWVDLVYACHRNDVTHQVDSLIYWNGPQGFDPKRSTRLPGLGPHGMTARDRGNAYTRKPQESYVSEPFDLRDDAVTRLRWVADLPPDAGLKFQLRWAARREDLDRAEWRGPQGPGTYFENSGGDVGSDEKTGRWMQYRALFIMPYGGKSAVLTEVRLELK